MSFFTGQCPVMKYHRNLMNAILYERIKIADAVNVQVRALPRTPVSSFSPTCTHPKLRIPTRNRIRSRAGD